MEPDFVKPKPQGVRLWDRCCSKDTHKDTNSTFRKRALDSANTKTIELFPRFVGSNYINVDLILGDIGIGHE